MASSKQQIQPGARKRDIETASMDSQVQGETKGRFNGCSNVKDYVMLSKLGEGTFGEVYKATSRVSGQILALKKILMHQEKDGFPVTALREIRILKMLSHPNILKLEEIAIERGRSEPRRKAVIYMVTPYMNHDLSGLLENPQVTFTEGELKCYMLQLLKGVAYLHKSNILHRDLKAANLLINNDGLLQIADFGLARSYDDESPRPGGGNGKANRAYTAVVVTRWYRPPELLLQLRNYTPAIDMWGVGCVIAEMFNLRPILPGTSDMDQLRMIFKLVGSPTESNMPGWNLLPGSNTVHAFPACRETLTQKFAARGPLFISLLQELLLLDWGKRINAIDALKHPYFSTDPQPLEPSEMPSFPESHELDRRRFREQRANLPAAPAGGSSGMIPDSDGAKRVDDAESLRSNLPSQSHKRLNITDRTNITPISQGYDRYGPHTTTEIESRVPGSSTQQKSLPQVNRPIPNSLPQRPPVEVPRRPPRFSGSHNGSRAADAPWEWDRDNGTYNTRATKPHSYTTDTYIPSYALAKQNSRAGYKPSRRDDPA